MDYYNKITILNKYYKTHLSKENFKEANRTLNQMKVLHGKVIETLLSLSSSRDDNKLELLSDLERINYKIIKIIDNCDEPYETKEKEGQSPDEQDEQVESKPTQQKNKLNRKLNSLVLFHAEWCGHCKNFMPTWDALTKLIPKDIINMVKISCVEKEKECGAIKEIRGYPTIIFVDMKVSKTITFSGSRDPESIIEFINECMGSQVLKLA
jgi:thiol-disulfide isomerase/thioredoxin